MQFDDIRITLYKILSLPENLGKYITCEQICKSLEKEYPAEWNKICEAYSVLKYGTYDCNFFSPYDPKRFVESALRYYSMNNGIPGLETQKIYSFEKKFNQSKDDNKIFLWKLVI